MSTSNEALNDPLGFSGAYEILQAWSDGLRPDPNLTVSEWADEHRQLAAKASAEPGKYRTARTPYMREIMDALSPQHSAQRIVFMKGAQLGATEAGNNWVGYVIHHAPGPMLAVQPTVELARRNSQQRIDTLIEESAVLKERVRPARARDSGNTILSKGFPGGILILTGANSAVGLRSMPARYLFFDEVDAYPASASDEGDPVALAEERSNTFGHRLKEFLVSTPKIAGSSRVEREYEASDQRRYFVPCPHCKTMQTLEFERLRWEKGRPKTARYHCCECEEPIEEHHKTWMLENGEWRATVQVEDSDTISFQISAMYSPIGWKSWSKIARQWESAQGSEEALKVFRNTVLGLPWIERGDAPDWQRLYDRRESWPAGTVPDRAALLTAGADVQKDRIEVDIWGWGRGLESWLVDHIVIEKPPGVPQAWDQLTQVLGKTWRHENGAVLPITVLGIDTGGHDTQLVYAWARQVGFGQVAPLKGDDRVGRNSAISGPTYVDLTDAGKRIKRGVRLWTAHSSVIKAETYRCLRLPRPTDEDLAAGETYLPGTIHLPQWVDAEWCRQMVSEHLVTVRGKNGASKQEWRKIRERNEALDCRTYARAGAIIAGIDRWSEDDWSVMEARTRATPPPSPTKSKGRGVRSAGINA